MTKERENTQKLTPKLQAYDIAPDRYEKFMREALLEAHKAVAEDEIPVGAILVRGDDIILRDHNRTRQLQNPLAHCEMLILNEIQKSEKYLTDYTLYVTLEPCLMCAGAIILSRLGRVVFGAADPKTGVVGSVYDVLADKHFNHHPKVVSGILAEECGEVLREFFRGKRKGENE